VARLISGCRVTAVSSRDILVTEQRHVAHYGHFQVTIPELDPLSPGLLLVLEEDEQ
jgi:hypothetical protein